MAYPKPLPAVALATGKFGVVHGTLLAVNNGNFVITQRPRTYRLVRADTVDWSRIESNSPLRPPRLVEHILGLLD
jgi:hypothetical protein